MTGPGFVFWGLFVACAVVLAGYVAWMLWEKRGHQDAPGDPAERGGRDPEPKG